MFFQYPPECSRVRCPYRFTFKENSGSTCKQWSIQDVGVAYHPTDIRSAKHYISRTMYAEQVLDREIQANGMTGSFTKDAFRETCRTCKDTLSTLEAAPKLIYYLPLV